MVATASCAQATRPIHRPGRARSTDPCDSAHAPPYQRESGEHGEAELVVRPLGGAGLYRTWCAVRRANETLTASQRGFLGVCTTLFPTLVSGGDADAPQ